MNAIIDAALGRSRMVLLSLAVILIAGSVAYIAIPKEAAPDIPIPIIFISMTHEGISPEDAERLLVRPMEKELQSIEGLKEMRATAREGSASVLLEFEAGFDSDQALQDVREKVDLAKAELPAETDEPIVNEINIALFPVVVVTLSGNVPERTLITLARDLQDRLETLEQVLEVEIAGDREEVVDVIVDPVVLDSYQITHEEIIGFVQRNNRLVAAGALEVGSGRFPVKVPGLLEQARDVLELPLKVNGDRVVTFQEVTSVRRTFKDPEGFARVNGRPAVSLQVSKRIGENVIDTIARVRSVVEEERLRWPAAVRVDYLQDQSRDIRDMLKDLQNNVISAIILVMVVVVAALGLREGALVGLAIPGSFLSGILVISALGLTINIVVLFSLIMAVGMLIDGAVVVTEYANRKMAEGLAPREAFAAAPKRMAWPIIAATVTTLTAFVPLLFWPGVVGEFMRFLPITLLATLGASLVMALIFIPTLGALVGRAGQMDERTLRSLAASESGDLHEIKGLAGFYLRVMEFLLNHPVKILLGTIALLVAVYTAYGLWGKGVEFFPSVEPERAVLNVRARGNLSVAERDALVQQVEQRLAGIAGIETVNSRSGLAFTGQELPEDVIGVILLQLADWRTRPPARRILAEVRRSTAALAGIVVEVREQEQGPPVGKPIQVELSSREPELLPHAVRRIRRAMSELDGFLDVEDSRPIPGIEWQVAVDRAQAARFGADVIAVGNAVQLVTNGIRVAGYRPEYADEEVDIVVRFPPERRDLGELSRLWIRSAVGSVPVSNFIKLAPRPRVGTIERVDGHRVMTVRADVPEGVLVDTQVQRLRRWLAENGGWDRRVQIVFKGEEEERQESGAFLSRAFGAALFLMAIVLVTQFNSFYQAFLILTSVLFSTVGVLLGLLTFNQPFGIVMTGVGMIALAGVVVNNNIVLIDTYNVLRKRGLAVRESVLRAGVLRLRPVLLTTVTTVLGLLPMVIGMNIDLIHRDVTFGAPSTQWWSQLATAVAGGLTFATALTLVLTPALLWLGHTAGRRWRKE